MEVMANQAKILLVWALLISLWAAAVTGQDGQSSTPQSAGDSESAETIQSVRSLLNTQDFKGAEAILKPATVKFADKPGPWYFLGYHCKAQQRYDEALAAYEKAKTFPRVKVNSLYNIACIYSRQNKRE